MQTRFSLHVWPNPGIGTEHNPIVVDFDPATGVANVPAVLYGDYGVPISCVGGGYVFSATGTIDITLDHFDAGSGGFYHKGARLKIVKQ